MLVPRLGPKKLGLFLVPFLHSCHCWERNTSHQPTDPKGCPRDAGNRTQLPIEPSVAQPAYSRHVSQMHTSCSVARIFFFF